MRARYQIVAGISLVAALALAGQAGAQAAGRKVANVEAIRVDSTVSLPAGFSVDALRREMEIALESTGLFTVPTHNKDDLKGVVAERQRQHAGSSGAGQKASLVLNPTLETVTFGERRRLAPMNHGKDAVSAEGQVSMTVQVLSTADGSVQTRMPIEVPFHGPEHMADPLANDPLAARNANANTAVHGQATPEEYRALYLEVGRVFARRVLDQVNPTLVASADGGKLYLTRGEDAGYKVGDILRVIHRGTPIPNPVTHEIIGYHEDRIGTAKVIEVQPRLTIAQVEQSTRDAVVGDIVRDLVEKEN